MSDCSADRGPSTPEDFDFEYLEWYSHEKQIRTRWGRLLLRLEIGSVFALLGIVALLRAPGRGLAWLLEKGPDRYVDSETEASR